MTELCVSCVERVDGVDGAGNDIIVVDNVPVVGQKWVVFDENEQKIVIGKYKRVVREKEKQWHCCQEQKKLLIAVVWGQLDDDTQAQMELLCYSLNKW